MIYSFLNNQDNFLLYFFDGKKLKDKIFEIHNIGPNAKKFYDEVLLTSVQFINLMKSNENLGFYIDSEDPYFRFKIEMSSNGYMRTLLLPEEFSVFPDRIIGKARLTKSFPNQNPYTSIIPLECTLLSDVATEIIRNSYQTQAEIILLNDRFSIMLVKLPDLESENEKTMNLEEYLKQNKFMLEKAKQEKFENEESLNNFFKIYCFQAIGNKDINFHCPCSKERMVTNMCTLSNADREEIFSEKDGVEVRCDYCNTNYLIKKSDLITQ